MQSNPFGTTITTILTLAILMGTLILQTVTTLYATSCTSPFPWSIWVTSFARSSTVLMDLVHMSVSKVTLEVFNTHPLPIEGTERAAIDLTMRTDSSHYKLLESLAIVALITIVIGYPIVTIVYRTRTYARTKEGTPEAQERFIKATGNFRVRRYGFLWETVTSVVYRRPQCSTDMGVNDNCCFDVYPVNYDALQKAFGKLLAIFHDFCICLQYVHWIPDECNHRRSCCSFEC